MEEGDTNGTCSEIEYVATQAMCATLVESEGRRIDGLTRDAGIVGFFWVFGRHARYGVWDEAKVDGRGGSSYSAIHSPGNGTKRRPGEFRRTFKRVVSMFGLICRVKKVVAAHLSPLGPT